MKKVSLYGLIFAITLFCCISPMDKVAAVTNNTSKPIEGSTEELYQDIFVTLLDPYIQKTVDNYYLKYFKDAPSVAPYSVDILSAERPNGYRTFLFTVKIKVLPYLGPHLTVGEDNITIKIAGNNVEVEKFEHLKSFDLPWNYQNEIKNKWPPN